MSNKVRLVDNPGPQSLRARISANTEDKIDKDKIDATDSLHSAGKTIDNVARLLRRFTEAKQNGP
ncbi:hypothetical protein PTTG_25629 [Puccinia triticina 1-1 BBBD Race 1]|uniref:Uncharacterized protein n=1 Tax=Puccinia triticina (isolate 1-1 / race 1 (BBBD)) TaxID=630390 RepID=A0A180H1S5_PUCT1|nr:hypothetical protein PTTG_25629 [Puccinia triticina 1-1 BBBD Race 1]